MMKLLKTLTFFAASGAVFASSFVEKTINADWSFKKAGDKEFMKANVPGTVHTDLLLNKKIPDPYWSDNEKSLQYIENEDWEYSGKFSCDTSITNKKNVEIVFEGLDTYAKVFLNGKEVLNANNMFRTWRVNVKNYIKSGENVFLIHFSSAVKSGKASAKKLKYTLPGDEKVFTRKEQCQYGWDWGPRFVTCGIWRDIKIKAWDDYLIQDIAFSTKSIKSDKAEIKGIINVNSNLQGKLKLTIVNSKNKEQYLVEDINLRKGENTYDFSFNIANPILWYCNGQGEPYLYNLDCKISSPGEDIVLSKKLGVRTIETVIEKDKAGSSFYFKLNGKPVFMKGANYIPIDNFLPRVSVDKYEEMIKASAQANMNMLRVWGGGVYERDEFYDLCDKYGILVWQDFMFACSMYPGDKEFIDNVAQEAKDNIIRLRNHPSIAMWCGNNEVDEGWQNWGWQKQFKYSKKDSAKIWNDYKAIFHKTLGDAVKNYGTGVFYWPSSPSIGWGRKESLLQGDSHYWGVWWGMQPFEIYNEKVGRFMSEYGFQGTPSLETFKTICEPKDLRLESDAIKNHQKHPTGYPTINTYMERDYNIPSSFEKYIYVSQLLQAEGMKTAIEAHRRNKPYCMGTLYWQLNDCWPVTSWSSLDYYNNWKAFHYYTKKLYSPVVILVNKEKNSYKININSDKQETIKGTLNVKVLDFTGKVLYEEKNDLMIPENSSASYFELKDRDLKGFDKKKIVLKCEFKNESELITENYYYFNKPKDLQLSEPKIQIRKIESGEFEITCSSLAKNIELKLKPELKAKLSDNYFDLLPGEKKILSIVGAEVIVPGEIAIQDLYNVNK